MIAAAENVEQLARAIAGAPGRIESADLSRLDRLVEHAPEDMTATAEAGMTLADLQAALRPHHQWVPLDPPFPERLTIGDLLAFDWSGPRRFGCGTVREHVIGMRVVLGSGEVIKAGGKVVKNVAGYDLCRLFTGARHSLGLIVEAVFKLRPIPEQETLLQRECASLDAAEELARQVRKLPGEPVILDLHRGKGPLAMVLGFAGACEDVEALQTAAEELGFEGQASLDYDGVRAQWGRESLLPSRTLDRLRAIGDAAFVARLGNGIVYHDRAPRGSELPASTLMARMKQAFDPRGVLPEFR